MTARGTLSALRSSSNTFASELMPIAPFDGLPHSLTPGAERESSGAVQLATPSGDYPTPAMPGITRIR